MRTLVVLAALLCLALAVRKPIEPRPILHEDQPAIRDEMVDYINGLKTTWKASKNQGSFGRKSIAEVKRLLGAKKGGPALPEKTQFEIPAANLPTAYDPRTVWANCTSMFAIRDQSDCGSCWAFGAVEAMSDRNCIFLNQNISLSAQDMNSCSQSDGCGGGFPSSAWSYWVQTGVVTDLCSPYTLPGCDHHLPNSTNPCPANEYPTPPCVRKCNATVSNSTWSTSLHFGKNSYSITKGAVAIQQEILANGPVETAFTVYEDFLSYTSGVYEHKTGAVLGGHAVKILGWGVWENTTPYWIVANSWNPDWGNKGYFYMIRGKDNCGFEEEVSAGIPKN